MTAIVAGIINTRTGDLSDLITDTSKKTALFIKVRDVLNKTHGENSFAAFFFNGLNNISYVKKNMINKDSEITKPMSLLNCKFQIQSLNKRIEGYKKELTIANDSLDENESNELVADLLEDEIDDINRELEITQDSVIRW
jgi:hypothetical protein